MKKEKIELFIAWAKEHRRNEGGNRALTGAFTKGVRAAFEGGTCPYEDKRTHGNQVTFSRAFRREWFEGRALGDRWLVEQGENADD